MICSTPEAYQLLHEGSLASSRIEENGMRVDVGYLNATIKKLKLQIDKREIRLKESKFFKRWKKEFGHKTKMTSRQQLAHMLFEVMGFESVKKTKTGNPSTDVEALESIDNSFIREYAYVEKLKKAKNTYLTGIKRELEGDRIHPNINLNTAVSIRSSVNDPNSQNFPSRDPFFAKMVRTCFIPSPGHVIVEVDLKLNEVRVACCYCEDERLINDTLHGDMHRDMAAECFKLPKKKVTKAVRHVGKNGFVFPEFFGDFYGQIAPSMWDSIRKDKLTTPDGISLYQHLKSKGITKLGKCDTNFDPRPHTFEKHIKKVEDRFWNERYVGYKQWKVDWFDDYMRRKYFKMFTGFVIRWGKSGPCNRKQAVNYPIQGSAFHCLLWALIKLIKWLEKKKMKSKVITQIHDSIVADVHKKELQDFLEKVKQLLVVDIRKAWPWLTVPLGVEAEMSETNWYAKREIEI